MVAMQIRPYAPETSRSIMWISYGSGPFTAATPFYANVDDTPAYLRDTTPEVSTNNLYWANRLIAALATRISTKPAMRSKIRGIGPRVRPSSGRTYRCRIA